MMKTLWLVTLALPAFLLPGCATAQTAPASAPAPATSNEFASSASIQALIANAAKTIKPGEPVLVQPLLDFAPYKTILEYRQGVTISAIHKDEAEFFVVVKGGGTLMLGGELVEPKEADAHNIIGTRVTGATSTKHVAAGDVFVIPEGTPHWFSAIDGQLAMVVMKVPRTVGK